MMEKLEPDEPVDATDEELAVALEGLIERRESGIGEERVAAEGATGSNGAKGGCPGADDWLRFAAGQSTPAEGDALLAHAAFCPSCAQNLRLSLRVLDEHISPEETEELGRQASSSAQWQRRLAGELAATPRRRSTVPNLYLRIGAGVAASLLLAVPLAIWWQNANSPERLLAEAYERGRIFALRMPGAGYSVEAPGTHLRGGATDREPSVLLDARTRIERKLENAPQDPHWLELQARSDVLEENFNPAVDILDRLLAQGPVTAGLLTDDAAAYFQRGQATGSENDRATALDYLRRADELAPGDPVVLFNEAVVMEDRGQMMNAVETWNRYLRFERDPKWQAEGRSRLSALEQKLNRMKSHESRMEQLLSTPEAMRALAADAGMMAGIDEELASTLLPRILHSAFPPPVDRSRGSPCAEDCQAARFLLKALGDSLQRNHQDPWLNQFLPADSSSSSEGFIQAADLLGRAMDANVRGSYADGSELAHKSQLLFHQVGDNAGEDRAGIEQAYAQQRSFNSTDCRDSARALLSRDPQFAWIRISAIAQEAICNAGPGTAAQRTAAAEEVSRLARDHGYTFLEFRAANMAAGWALESGDAEDAWRIDLDTVRRFYAGDYPPSRIAWTIGGLADLEQSTPRRHLGLITNREFLALLELTGSRELIPSERMSLAAAAIRAGAISEAEDEMRQAQSEMALQTDAKPSRAILAEDEIAMAGFYLGRRDLKKASETLDAADRNLAGDDNAVHRRTYAAARGELELALARPAEAEALLRNAILGEEQQEKSALAAGNVVFAEQNRDLYAVLAGVWLEQGRPGDEILALWERYRLSILGEPAPVCPNRGLDCLKANVGNALRRMGHSRLMGQVVLPDRVLIYVGGSHGVSWTSLPVGKDELLDAAEPLERAASSPDASLDAADQAGRRIGDLLFRGLDESQRSGSALFLEPDPQLGNLPWPAVETTVGPIGLRFDLEEMPSLLLASRPGAQWHAVGNPLVVGASVAQGEDALLPEVPREARDVARYLRRPDVLVGGDATGARVSARIDDATAIHFAGHAEQHGGATRLLLAGSSGTAAPYLDSAILRQHPPHAARLAVFSACSSGKREEYWNHGMGDIVNTLAGLGVPEVVVTRWQIDSASAVPMMDAFYDGLARGFTVPQSLTQARLSLIRDPRYRHPYYWAAYYASGMGNTDLREVFHGDNR
jgi:tetratricopeptide (TPR) repeat protein